MDRAPSGPPPPYYSNQPANVQVQQPGHGRPQQQQTQWMNRPAAPTNSNCPPGLEYLLQIDQFLVKQEVEMLEVITGFETCNRYRVLNSMGQQIFYAMEESHVLGRMFMGNWRHFTIHILDNGNREVMRVVSNQLQQIVIEAPPGIPVGFVNQEGSCYNPTFVIFDGARRPIFKIIGPSMFCNCNPDVNFNVYSNSTGAVIGNIMKQWSGFSQEFFTDAENFAITFPVDLDVRLKATMLGALFLIDFMFFEQTPNNS